MSTNEGQAQELVTMGQPSPTATEPTNVAPKTVSADDWAGRVAGVIIMVIIGSVLVLNSQRARTFVWDNSLPISLVGAAGLIALVIMYTRRALRKATATVRAGFSIFLVVPLILGSLVAIFLFPPSVQVLVLRTIFLLSVCLLPGTMFYLFIATKKYALVNEFLTNLVRLGLITSRNIRAAVENSGDGIGDSSDEGSQRVAVYIKKFEAVFGPIPADYYERSKSGDGDRTKAGGNTTPIGLVFTTETALPVVLATVLIALGWVLTLPPWQGTFLEGRRAAIPSQISGGQPLKTEKVADAAQQQQPKTGQETETQKAEPGASSSTDSGFDWAKLWISAVTPIQTPVHFAFIGAYFFSLQMLFRRYVRRDLRGSAYVGVSLRAILAVIGTWAAIPAVNLLSPETAASSLAGNAINYERVLLALGFAIGVFPRVVWQVIQSTVKKILGIVLPSFQTQLPISDLDGLTVWHEARLEEEDIENVPNMATADLVDLMLNTRLPADRIIDWVDQAILYTHLGPDGQSDNQKSRREVLRFHGIYTASSLLKAYEESKKRGDVEQFETVLPSEHRNTIRSLVDTVKTNPNLRLILQWRGLESLAS